MFIRLFPADFILANQVFKEGGPFLAEQVCAGETSVTANNNQFVNTQVNGNTSTAVIESDAFELTPITSFVYGTFAGPVSAYFDKPGAWLTKNGLMIL